MSCVPWEKNSRRSLGEAWGDGCGPAAAGPAGPTNLLTATPDEVAIAIACQLGCAADLLRLAMACSRFRVKTVWVGGNGNDTGSTEAWSIVSEAARRMLAGDSRVPRRPTCQAGSG